MKPMVLYKYKVVNNSDTQYLSYELYIMYHTDENFAKYRDMWKRYRTISEIYGQHTL